MEIFFGKKKFFIINNIFKKHLNLRKQKNKFKIKIKK